MRRRPLAAMLAALVAVAACGPGPSPTGEPGGSGDPVPTGAPEAPVSSFEKINTAEEAGLITDEQALVYDVLATFADPRLPAEYRGDDADLVDGLAVAEAVARWDALSAENRAVLAPFLAWPGDSDSWLAQRVAAAAPGAVLAAARMAKASGDIIAIDDSPNVRVWYRADRPADEAAARDVAATIDRDIWPKLAGLMGAPLSDLGLGNPDGNGEDARIDIVLTGEDIRSYARPFDCDATSGYIGLGASHVKPAVLAHELMHVIAFKYPAQTGCQHPEYSWLQEATAQWAIDFVDPASQVERGMKSDLLPKRCFLDVPGLPLDLANDCHEYASYLFLQYLARSQSPDLIPRIWEATATADSLNAIDAALAAAGGLAEVWPDFALAAYNLDPSARFRDWDGLAYGARLIATPVTLGGASERELTARGDVEHAANLYTDFRFEDGSIREVELRHPFAGHATARLTAVIKREGEPWSVEDWTGIPERRFCYDDADQPPFEQLVVIVSNSDPSSTAAPLDGDATLRVADTCGSGRGTVTITREQHGTYTSARGNPVKVDMVDTATITFDLVDDGMGDGGGYVSEAATITWSYTMTAVESADGCEIVEEARGGGTWDGSDGPSVLLGFAAPDGTVFGMTLDEGSYVLQALPPSHTLPDDDPNANWQGSGVLCNGEIVVGLMLPYTTIAVVDGRIPEPGGTFSGSRKRVLPPLLGQQLETTETVTWSFRVDGGGDG